jgi:hypothetical protein
MEIELPLVQFADVPFVGADVGSEAVVPLTS